MKRVIVGLSGGVDSAVAAYLLKREGYDVVGVTLRTWTGADGNESRCCEIDDARETARSIGIPYHVFNCVSAFEDKVVKPFVDDYLHGMTPNPCVVCNREIKWERLLYHAKVLGADLVATGHYACVVRLENGRYTVRKASHAEKDQTYMLYRLTQEQLARTLMPLGDYSKAEVRETAREAGISVAEKPDSQEICFVADGDYADFISEHENGAVPGEGDFVDEAGRVLGRHRGVIHYTVGQRKGLGVAFGRPIYVKEIRADRNEIVLAGFEETYAKAVVCRDMNFMSIPEPGTGEAVRCLAKVRYRHSGCGAALENLGGGSFRADFDAPVRFAAPGQSAVFYDEDGRLMCGGVISEVIFS
ncbi:MAG: tRNA 2-thiouridine(34) synthase MnmA [Oscillospiraceae bacterium]|nr:tRNA 2-thiouridine(34) synthase MnmA [Oscillospiraceae bacterium]